MSRELIAWGGLNAALDRMRKAEEVSHGCEGA